MALIPIQDVEASAFELRRAVKELGMSGGMLPSNGEGIKNHLGSKYYWPLYEEAEKLGCSLAVHVGSLHHLGMDGFSTYYAVHALGHPFGIAIQAASLLSHGIFEKFPKLRVAFLEGGSTGRIILVTCRLIFMISSSVARDPGRRQAIICAGKYVKEEFTSDSTSMTTVWASRCKRPAETPSSSAAIFRTKSLMPKSVARKLTRCFTGRI